MRQAFDVAFSYYPLREDNQMKIRVGNNQYIIEKNNCAASIIVSELTKYGNEMVSRRRIGYVSGFEESFLGRMRAEGAEVP